MLSGYVIKQLKESQEFAAVLTLSTQHMYEQEDNIDNIHMSSKATYQCEAYELLEKIVVQGQREGGAVYGDAVKLVDSMFRYLSGGFRNPDTEKLTRTLGYSTDARDISMTYLTKLDIPSGYGAYRIKDFSFIPPVISYRKRLTGIRR